MSASEAPSIDRKLQDLEASVLDAMAAAGIGSSVINTENSLPASVTPVATARRAVEPRSRSSRPTSRLSFSSCPIVAATKDGSKDGTGPLARAKKGLMIDTGAPMMHPPDPTPLSGPTTPSAVRRPPPPASPPVDEDRGPDSRGSANWTPTVDAKREKRAGSRSLIGIFSKLGKTFRKPQPPTNARRVLIQCKDKSAQDLKAAVHLQTLECKGGQGALWVLKASVGGKYVAVAGQDPTVRVWRVAEGGGGSGGGKDDGKSDGTSSNISGDSMVSPETAMFEEAPYRLYSGHKADVIDLAWSKTGFLLSASIDKTVRLWHVSRQRSLCVFRHPDFVTSVAFHPSEDRYFLSGSFDKKLRVWCIPEHRVTQWAQAPNVITAASYSPDGEMAVAGLHNGRVVFYEAESLRYFTQIDCRNRYGKHKNGRKVTGVQYSRDGKHLLVTTNDSRIRIVETEGYSVSRKLKGLSNGELQIRASFSPDGKYVVSGSDEPLVYIWRRDTGAAPSLTGKLLGSQQKRQSSSHQTFRASNDTVTSAQFLSLRGTTVVAVTDFNGRIKIFGLETLAEKTDGGGAGLGGTSKSQATSGTSGE